jgi:hypothetical protein
VSQPDPKQAAYAAQRAARRAALYRWLAAGHPAHLVVWRAA